MKNICIASVVVVAICAPELRAQFPCQPEFLSSLGGIELDLKIVGSHAYVANRTGGLYIYDVSIPSSPDLIGTFDTPGEAQGVTVSGSVAFVADQDSLQMIDISDPSSPTFLGSISTPPNASVAIENGVAFVTLGGPGLQIIDVEDPTSPEIIVSFPMTGTANGIEVHNGVVVV